MIDVHTIRTYTYVLWDAVESPEKEKRATAPSLPYVHVGWVHLFVCRRPTAYVCAQQRVGTEFSSKERASSGTRPRTQIWTFVLLYICRSSSVDRCSACFTWFGDSGLSHYAPTQNACLLATPGCHHNLCLGSGAELAELSLVANSMYGCLTTFYPGRRRCPVTAVMGLFWALLFAVSGQSSGHRHQGHRLRRPSRHVASTRSTAAAAAFHLAHLPDVRLRSSRRAAATRLDATLAPVEEKLEEKRARLPSWELLPLHGMFDDLERELTR